jgi:hypothetical protein
MQRHPLFIYPSCFVFIFYYFFTFLHTLWLIHSLAAWRLYYLTAKGMAGNRIVEAPYKSITSMEYEKLFAFISCLI